MPTHFLFAVLPRYDRVLSAASRRAFLLPVLMLVLICHAPRSPLSGAESVGETAPLSADEIVRRAVLRDDQLRASRMALKCDRIVLTQRLDASGKVTETSTVRSVEYPTNAFEYSTTMDPAKTSGAGSTASGDAKGQKIEVAMSLRRLAPRYDMTLHGEDSVRGQLCYIIDYRPKASQPSTTTREEKAVSNLRGRFWISKSDYSVMQSEGSLVGPVSMALVASVNQLDIKFRSQAMPNGDTGPFEVTVNMAVKAPFYDFRQRQVTTEENWRAR